MLYSASTNRVLWPSQNSNFSVYILGQHSLHGARNNTHLCRVPNTAGLFHRISNNQTGSVFRTAVKANRHKRPTSGCCGSLFTCGMLMQQSVANILTPLTWLGWLKPGQQKLSPQANGVQQVMQASKWLRIYQHMLQQPCTSQYTGALL